VTEPQQWDDLSPEMQRALIDVAQGRVTADEAIERLGIGQRDEERQ